MLLCANCHREVHNSLIHCNEINNLPVFNEDYANYLNKQHIEEQDNCPICGNLKPVEKIVCSRQCSGKQHSKVDWDFIDLQLLMNSYSTYKQMGDSLGITGAAVKRKLRQSGLV